MRGKNTIFINGHQYDAVTGLAIGEPVVTSAPKVSHPNIISDFGPVKHSSRKVTVQPQVERQVLVKPPVTQLQKSKTLRREAVRRPIGTHESTVTRPARSPGLVAKSSSITKFAEHPQPRAYTAPQTPTTHSLSPRSVHKPAIVQAVHKAAAETKSAPVKPVALSSRELKEHLIAEKLASVDTKKAKAHRPSRTFFAAHPRAASVMAACFALVILGGYLTYLNMPNLSVRVAAAQAGVDARFPEYRPDGYRFNGPIAYAPGEVTMHFQSNGGKQAYEIKQKNSSWDSQAVLDNYVTKQSTAYLTYSEQGLTVYTYQNKAAWVNGGILYTIDGDAPLSNEQVLRIAASM